MKRNKLLSRGTALLLALALTLGLCPVSLAAGRSLTLRSLEDLTAFAKNCASDRYSDGLTVRLAADIDAEGTPSSWGPSTARATASPASGSRRATPPTAFSAGSRPAPL